jgi:hypothetical protein
MKILIIFVNKDISESYRSYIPNIETNLIKELRKYNVVDIATVLSTENNILKNDAKYNFICNKGQVSKICHLFDNIDYDEYDWYIKVRPDITFSEKINTDKLLKCNKNKINCRVRSYIGNNISVKHGTSIKNIPFNNINRNNCIQKNSEEINITPDDIFFIFNKKIAEKAFKSLSINDYLHYSENIENIENQFAVDTWMHREDYWLRNPIEREGHFKFILLCRNVSINIIGVNLTIKNNISLSSGDL